MTLRWSDEDARVRSLRRLLSDKTVLSIGDIWDRIATRPEWRRLDGLEFPRATLEREARRMLREHVADFIQVEPDHWRRRSRFACSSCLRENLLVGHIMETKIYLCLECAEDIAKEIREHKARLDAKPASC